MLRQRGIGFIGLLFVLALAIIVAILGMKTVPAVIEYFTIKKVVSATAHSPEMRDATPADVRASFDRRASIDAISSITGRDLEIRRDGGDLVVSFAYERRVPLFGPVTLLFDFKGASSSSGRAPSNQ